MTIYNSQNLHELLVHLPRETFVVALFMHSLEAGQDEWLNPLAKALAAKGFVTIGIKTPQSADKCDLSLAQYQAVIKPEELKTLDRINVFIFSDNDYGCDYPSTSKALGCCHGFISGNVGSLPVSTFQGHYLDGWMLSTPLNEIDNQKITSFWRGLLNQQISPRQSSIFHIIPTGYPRMAVLSKKLRSITIPPDSIVYAPTAMGAYKDRGGNRLQQHGKRIIRILLTAFPEMNVIFRPYKNDLSTPEVKEICETFADNRRFIFDNESGRLTSFSRGTTVITDLSHIDESFAFTTLRPAIRFQPWVKNNSTHEFAGGLIANTYNELVAAVKNVLSNPDQWKQKIQNNRNALAMPVENALEDIADWIVDFYNDKPKPGWVSIERRQPKNMRSEKDIVKTILEQEPTGSHVLAAATANFSLPDSPLLMALALHLGLVYRPDNGITFCGQTRNTMAKLLNKSFNFVNYKDIDPKDIRMLYSRSLLAMIKKNDADGVFLVEKLLEEFNQAFPETNSNDSCIDKL